MTKRSREEEREALLRRIAELAEKSKRLTTFDLMVNHPVNLYPAYCATLLAQFKGCDFVFVERDALPFMWIMELYRGTSPTPRFHSFYLCREMLSQSLKDMLPSYTGAIPLNDVYKLRKQAIDKYVLDQANQSDQALVYLRQELATVESGAVIVDSGYWGTMPLLAQAVLPEKNFRVSLFVGPECSPAYQKDLVGPEHIANRCEHYFQFTYDSIAFRNVGGILVPDKRHLWDYHQAQFDEQRAALLKMARNYRETGNVRGITSTG